MISLLLFSLKSLAVLCVALLVTRKHRFTASVRHLILVVAIASLPVLFILGEWSPNAISIEPPAVVHAWAMDIDQSTMQSTTVAETASFWSGVSIGSTAVAFYALVCSGLLLYWIARIVYTSIWIAHTRVLRVESLHIAGVNRQFTLRQSDRTGSPVTWGMLRPNVVVPKDWSVWPAAKQRAVLIHELSHVRRFDTFTSLFSLLISCLMWASPLVWLVHARLLAEAEHACDDAVIEQGISATVYASQLLEITRTRGMNAAPAMASQSTMSQRIRALLDSDTRRKSMTYKQVGTILCLALAVVLPIGTIGAQSAVTIAEVSAEREVSTISETTFAMLAQVTELIEMKDYAAALELIDAQLSQSQRLNGNEIGQYHSMRGFIYFSLEDYPNAIAAYQEVVAQEEELPVGLELTTLYTLAQLSFVGEQFQDALHYMEIWVAKTTNPSPAPYIFMGQVYYQMKDYPSAIGQIEQGIQVAQERSKKTGGCCSIFFISRKKTGTECWPSWRFWCGISPSAATGFVSRVFMGNWGTTKCRFKS